MWFSKTIFAHKPLYFARIRVFKPCEIDELLVSPGNAYKLLATDQTITG